jgi:hypothetical protein
MAMASASSILSPVAATIRLPLYLKKFIYLVSTYVNFLCIQKAELKQLKEC